LGDIVQRSGAGGQAEPGGGRQAARRGAEEEAMRVGDWLLTAARLAVHLPTATGVLADLHLGYGEARRRGGEAVPASSVETDLAPLRPVLTRWAVRRLVIAGDLFEAGPRADVTAELLAWLSAAGVELFGVVPGNHDRGLAQRRDLGLPLCPDGCDVGGWRVVHGDAAAPSGPTVQGHEHPCVRWSERLAAPCYLIGPDRLVLPAVSPDAAGVNVLRQPRWAAFRCGVLVGDEVLDFGLAGALNEATRRSLLRPR
jgi:metallophosphoesterase superfamily enzyme